MSTYSRNSSLATALRTLEDYAFAGFTLEGDDIPRLRATVDRLAPAAPAEVKPVDMLLFCPKCATQHVDAPDERTLGWDNPPHRSHLCHACGHIWRPADVPTNGVASLATKGERDDSPVPLAGVAPINQE